MADYGNFDDEVDNDNISNNNSNSKNLYDIDIDKLSDDELLSLDESRVNLLSEDNYRKFLFRLINWLKKYLLNLGDTFV